MLPVVSSEVFHLGEVAAGVEGVMGPVAFDSGMAVGSSASPGSYS